MSEINPIKPKFREPCNGCGLCCALELCELADQSFLGASAPCPALEYSDGRFWCGMIRHPSRHLKGNLNIDEYLTPLVIKVIGAGQGCGMPDEELVKK